MRTPVRGAAAFAALALAVAACGGGATPTPAPSPSPAASTAASPSPAASTAASASAAASPSPSPVSLKIGVVTDIGTLNDKGFNEFSFKGAVDGATAIGAPAPQSIVPKDASEYKADIQQFVDQKYDMIVTVGFNLTNDTVAAAKANPKIHFLGVDQSPICVDPKGNPDTTFACKGDPKTLLPNYASLYFAEDQAGYLAGIVAASADKTGTIGAIGGTTLCASCVRYIQGYDLGAKSIKSSINVKAAYVTNDFSAAAFNDPAGGKAFALTFISANHPDVLFQVAGKTGNGVLEAACQQKIYGVGVDVDQYASLNAANDPTYSCIITSAEKNTEQAVKLGIESVAAGTFTPGDTLFNASNDGIGVADFHDKASMFGPDVTTAIQTALAGMKAGTLKTCPNPGCGDSKTPLP